MFQSEASFERARVNTLGSLDNLIFGESAVPATSSDDDALLDSWLASMGTREFEMVLSRLADIPTGLEASA
jgi:hypothetical protein